jgi:hypothetical protein
MANNERPDLTQALRRASEASLRYYQGWGQLTVDYVSSLVGLVGDLTRSSRPVATHAHDERPTSSLVRVEPTPGRAVAVPQAPAMVLEAEFGGQAVGAFLVENRLAQRVSTPVVASTFVGPEGREVRPRLSLDPEIVTLEPGEQVLVRVVSLIDEQLEPGVTYRGSVSVPGLGGSNVRLVLRRHVADVAAVPPSPRPRRPATRRRKAV